MKDMNVLIDDGNIVGYKVNVAITFVLEDTAHSDEAVPSTTGQDAPLAPGQEPTY